MLAKILKTLRRAESSVSALHQKIAELEKLATEVRSPQVRALLDEIIAELKQELDKAEQAVQGLRIRYAIECGNSSW